MRTRTPALKAALVTATLAALTLTACELPDKKDDAKAAEHTEKPVATVSAPTASPTPSSAPSDPKASSAGTPAGQSDTKRPSATATGRPGAYHLVAAAQAGGYRQLTGAAAPSDVPVDPGDVGSGMNVLVTAYGSAPSGPREVLVVGVDGLTAVDGKRMEHMIRGMVDYVNGDGGSVPQDASMRDYAAGPLGGTLQCMPAQDAFPAAICAWADKNTVVVAYFDSLSADAAAQKLAQMRGDLEK